MLAYNDNSYNKNLMQTFFGITSRLVRSLTYIHLAAKM
jgi:hypothetical protein